MFKFIIIFIVGLIALVSVPHIGGKGLMLPNNVSIWFLAVIFVLYSVWVVLDKQRVVFGLASIVLVLSLWLVFAISLINTDSGGVVVFQYFLAFLVISAFVLATQQHIISHAFFLQLLVVVIIIGLMHALVSIIQVQDVMRVWYSVTDYAPLYCSCKYPLGIIQQSNMHATFMATVIISALYVTSFKSYDLYNPIVRWLVLISLVVSLYSLLLGVSRAGWLSLVLGVFLVSLARYKAVVRNKRILLLWSSAFIAAYLLSWIFPNLSVNMPVDSILEGKLDGLEAGTDLRLAFYKLSFQLFLQQPMFGYGLEGYSSAIKSYIAEYGVPSRFEEKQGLIARFTHPHNELLLWLVYSGLAVFFAMLVFISAVLYSIRKQRAGFSVGIIAILMPFSIQMMVSLPFSLSGLHLFGLLFFVVYLLRASSNVYVFSISKMTKVIVILFLLSMMFVVTGFYVYVLHDIYSNFVVYDAERHQKLIDELIGK